MKRLLCGLLCAVAVVACSAGAAEAAQIVYVTSDPATGIGWYQGWYDNGTPGPYGGDFGFGFDISSGTPDYDTDKHRPDPGPVYIDHFTWSNQGGGGGGGGNQGGGGGGTTGITYELVLNENKDFTFEVLFYDANYTTRNAGLGTTLVGTDVALSVRLIEADSLGPPDAWHEIMVAELEAGIYMIWAVEAKIDEKITTEVVWVNGDGIGAAAFFMDNVVDGVAIPEPATVGLIGLGMGFLLVRRKK